MYISISLNVKDIIIICIYGTGRCCYTNTHDLTLYNRNPSLFNTHFKHYSIHTTVYLQITQVTSTETRKLREEYTPSKNKHSNYIYARNKTK